jgi:hypothetical protein
MLLGQLATFYIASHLVHCNRNIAAHKSFTIEIAGVFAASGPPDPRT